MKYSTIVTFLLLVSVVGYAAESPDNWVNGTWVGKIHIPGDTTWQKDVRLKVDEEGQGSFREGKDSSWGAALKDQTSGKVDGWYAKQYRTFSLSCNESGVPTLTTTFIYNHRGRNHNYRIDLTKEDGQCSAPIPVVADE